MSPLRWDVLAVSFVLALPVLAMGARGDLSVEEMTGRLPWCLLAGWAAVALLRYASAPPKPAPGRRPRPAPAAPDEEPSTPD